MEAVVVAMQPPKERKFDETGFAFRQMNALRNDLALQITHENHYMYHGIFVHMCRKIKHDPRFGPQRP